MSTLAAETRLSAAENHDHQTSYHDIRSPITAIEKQIRISIRLALDLDIEKEEVDSPVRVVSPSSEDPKK
nr:hypothetical protein [Tanacetum cinerariifolium]